MGVIVGLLGLVRAGLPDKTKVLLSADRGIGTSPELCRQVDAMGFKYLFRVTKQSKIITAQGEYTIHDQAAAGENLGSLWQGVQETWPHFRLMFAPYGTMAVQRLGFW